MVVFLLPHGLPGCGEGGWLYCCPGASELLQGGYVLVFCCLLNSCSQGQKQEGLSSLFSSCTVWLPLLSYQGGIALPPLLPPVNPLLTHSPSQIDQNFQSSSRLDERFASIITCEDQNWEDVSLVTLSTVGAGGYSSLPQRKGREPELSTLSS